MRAHGVRSTRLAQVSAPFPGYKHGDDGRQQQRCQAAIEQRRDGVGHSAQGDQDHDPEEGHDDHRRIEEGQTKLWDAV